MENAQREYTASSSTVSIQGSSTYVFLGLCRFYSEAQNIASLKELRAANITTPISFFVGDIFWTEAIANEIIQTFQFYEKRRWKEGRFHFSSTGRNSNQFRRVLEAAVQTKLFRRLIFYEAGNTATSYLGAPYAEALVHIFQHARDLERVAICDFDITAETASILSKGLISCYEEEDVGPHELIFDGSWNRFTGDRIEEHAALQLAKGLACNKTLQCLALKYSWIDDRTLSLLIQSLIGHRSLRRLQLTFSDFGQKTVSSLQSILSAPDCRLKELVLSDYVALSDTLRRSFNMTAFVLPMPVNYSLQSLSLSRQGLTDLDANLLLQNLWKFPQLRTIDLEFNRIQDLATVVRSLTAPAAYRPISRLRKLNLDYNECFEQIKNGSLYDKTEEDPSVLGILQLLHVFPQLGYLSQDYIPAVADYTKRLPAIVQHQMDMNRCGGFLLRGGADLPLANWSLVLGKANNLWKEEQSPARQANGIYHLLREGPAFGGRGAL